LPAGKGKSFVDSDLTVETISATSGTKAFQISPFQRADAFFSGIGWIIAFVIPYIGAQIYAAVFLNEDKFFNSGSMLFSAAVNTVFVFLLLACYLRHRILSRSPDSNVAKSYALMIVCALLLTLISIFHAHMVGTMSSLHLMLFLVVMIIISWFYRWRDVILLFLGGHAVLAAVVHFETRGWIDYAPLLSAGAKHMQTYLDWRVILATFVNYAMVMLIATGTLWSLRRVMEKLDAQRASAIHAMREEIARRHKSEQEKEKLIGELKEAFDRVNTLTGLLPMCASCKKIRDDKGYWNQLETYLKEYSDVEFSHSLCPDCAVKLYPDVELKKNSQ
jgi:hypothetical protein